MSDKRFEITAVLYDKRGIPLSIGKNSYIKTHPYQAKLAEKVGLDKKVYLHAEMSAILKCRDLKKAYRILVTRFDADGKPMMAKPCPICSEAIKLAGIKIIEHT